MFTFIYYNCLITCTKSFTIQAIMHALMTQNLIFQIQGEMNCILLHVFLSNPLKLHVLSHQGLKKQASCVQKAN